MVVVVNNSDIGRTIREIWKGICDNIYHNISILISICGPGSYCKVFRHRYHYLLSIELCHYVIYGIAADAGTD